MKTPKTILVINTDGTVRRFDAREFSVVVRTEPDTFTKRITAITNEETFYQLVDILGYTTSVRYTTERKSKFQKRLKSFTENEIVKAAKMIASDPWMQGENPQAKRYGTIDYLLRNDEIIDRYLNSEEKQYNLKEIEI